MTFNRFIPGARSSPWRERVVPMRNLAIADALFGVGCATPAYRAPEVPVPASYDVETATTVTSPAKESRADDESPGAVHISTTLASAPFWTALGDSTLTALGRGGGRGKMEGGGGEAALRGPRPSPRLARLDLVPTITG